MSGENSVDMVATTPHWTEYVSSLGPLLVAVFIAYVAYQQWVVNKANLRERLFEKRFELFKQTQRFLTSIMQSASVEDDQLPDFFDAVQRSRFLFGKDIQDYLDEIRKRALQMRMYKVKLERLEVGPKRSKIVELENRELTWLIEQGSVVFKKFGPYLSFGKNK